MISSDTYEEVYEILSLMDKLTVMKIPEDILKNIKTKRNANFKTKIDKDDIFNEKNVSKDTIDFICWLDYEFWIDKKRKMEIDKINLEKIKKSEEEKKARYNSDNVFKNREKRVIEKVTTNEMIVYKESFIKKILYKIKSIFTKK